MAMPSRNVISSGKTHFPATGGGTEAGVDGRDEFSSWLRSEFAAANAIIDALCLHLRSISGGEPGEYDAAIASIQQRRFYWTPVLYMQQHVSVSGVIYALQQVAWRKQNHHHQQQRHFKEFKRSGVGFKQGHRKENGSVGGNEKNGEAKSGGSGEGRMEDGKDDRAKTHAEANLKDSMELDVPEVCSAETKAEALNVKCISSSEDDRAKTDAEANLKDSGEFDVPEVCIAETKAEALNEKCISSSEENEPHAYQRENEKQNLAIMPKTFVAMEIYDGKMVNVVAGLKLYEELFDGKEVSRLVRLVNDLRAAGKKGQVLDAPVEDENAAGVSRDRKVGPVPTSLQDVVEGLVDKKIMSAKPDSCIIDFYNEGDHSQPHMFPHWFGRPVGIIFLSECDMTFGRVIAFDHPGDFRGSIKFSFSPGSLVVMEGKSADFAKHAINSTQKQRILITLTKSQPRNPAAQSAPPPSRSPNHFPHPARLKHYTPIPTTGVSPASSPSSVGARVPPPSGIQPCFMTTPAVPAMPFLATLAVCPTGWQAHPYLRIPLPGTGVFLPPGSGNATRPSPPPPPPPPEPLSTAETASFREKETSSVKSDHDNGISPKGTLDDKLQQKDDKGGLDGTDGGDVGGKDEQQSIHRS